MRSFQYCCTRSLGIWTRDRNFIPPIFSTVAFHCNCVLGRCVDCMFPLPLYILSHCFSEHSVCACFHHLGIRSHFPLSRPISFLLFPTLLNSPSHSPLPPHPLSTLPLSSPSLSLLPVRPSTGSATPTSTCACCVRRRSTVSAPPPRAMIRCCRRYAHSRVTDGIRILFFKTIFAENFLTILSVFNHLIMRRPFI